MKRLGPDQVEEAVSLLNEGGILIFPTETSYGIGCDATNADAVKRVYELKNRPEDMGSPILLPDVDSAERYLVVTDQMRKMMSDHWPGPLNIVGEVAEGSQVAQMCTQDGTQTARVSSNPVAASIAAGLGRPIVATSANKFGEPAIYDSAQIEDSLGADVYIDAGVLTRNPASTIVKITGEGVEIIRQGSIEL
ncbi:threonylcarbamoyl-AMP synthase [Candidatus Uhrbacteria bacterium]|jgi:tRNA threonylcarbamoyl adenosine modification protein (Sua5/YciO/YrdC/YwlC family)|nr:threonylcarbamoyl-AMP synthase [Candidatus Uhrbacteria bacterium]